MRRVAGLGVLVALILSGGCRRQPPPGASPPAESGAGPSVVRDPSPEAALQLQIAELRFTHVDVPTTLMILNNECGLLFGHLDLVGSPATRERFDLVVENQSVGQAIDSLGRRAPGYGLKTIEGVVVAARLSSAGERPALLGTRIPEFDVADATTAEFQHRLVGALQKVPGMPLLATFTAGPLGPTSNRRISLHLRNVSVEELLAKAPAAGGESCSIVAGRKGRTAAFDMVSRWPIPGSAGYKVRLAEKRGVGLPSDADPPSA